MVNYLLSNQIYQHDQNDLCLSFHTLVSNSGDFVISFLPSGTAFVNTLFDGLAVGYHVYGSLVDDGHTAQGLGYHLHRLGVGVIGRFDVGPP